MNRTFWKNTIALIAILIFHEVGLVVMAKARIMESVLAPNESGGVWPIMVAAGFVMIRLLTFFVAPGALLFLGLQWRCRRSV